MIDSWKDVVFWAMALVAFGGVVFMMHDCDRRWSSQRHERQMECIRQHIYCGEER